MRTEIQSLIIMKDNVLWQVWSSHNLSRNPGTYEYYIDKDS